MNKLLLSLCVLTLSACGKVEGVPTTFPVMPDELKDCKAFFLSRSANDASVNGPGASELTVLRCPMSTTTTTYKSGKTTRTVVVIDGQEYAPVTAASAPAK